MPLNELYAYLESVICCKFIETYLRFFELLPSTFYCDEFILFSMPVFLISIFPKLLFYLLLSIITQACLLISYFILGLHRLKLDLKRSGADKFSFLF